MDIATTRSVTEDASAAKGTNEALRFGFGRNWSDFLEQHFSKARVDSSREHLLRVLRVPSLDGLSFLDIGCGSGLHSLAALRAGALRVYGFDYDENSVEASRKVRGMAAIRDPSWTIEQGSVLDTEWMARLDKADVVYSWGVLHHTGDLWKAMDNAIVPMVAGGVLYIALYSSDQYVDPPARHWVDVKRNYNRRGTVARRIMEWKHASRLFAGSLLRGQAPWTLVRSYGARGMDFWTDIRDWLGGWPIEFASYAEVNAWGRASGLEIVNAIVGEGCTEYVLAAPAANARWGAEEARRLASLRPLPGPFVRHGGRAWVARLPELKGGDDSSLPPRGSTLMLYDRARPFGLPHFTHAHVARFGEGRFSHWQDYVLFSTPDGGDPNTKPSRWSFCAAY